ncbi:MAG: hypothetical protein ABI467_13080 [Kofleriaceae bacterium]
MRSLVVLAIGCGGTAPHPTHLQTVAEAMTLVCAAPTRAFADPDWGAIDATQGIRDPDQQAAFVINHLADGVTEPHVLDTIRVWHDTWRKPQPTRVNVLDALISEAALATCELRDLWAPPVP